MAARSQFTCIRADASVVATSIIVGDRVVIADPLSDYVSFGTVVCICNSHRVALVDLDNANFVGCYDLHTLYKMN